MATDEVVVPNADVATLGGERHPFIHEFKRAPLRNALSNILDCTDDPHGPVGIEFGDPEYQHPKGAPGQGGERQLQLEALASQPCAIKRSAQHGPRRRRVSLQRLFHSQLKIRRSLKDDGHLLGPNKVARRQFERPPADPCQLTCAAQEAFAGDE